MQDYTKKYCEFHGASFGEIYPKCPRAEYSGLTQIEHGRTLYQEYLRTDNKLRFIINLSIDDFASMQVYGKLKEDLSKTV